MVAGRGGITRLCPARIGGAEFFRRLPSFSVFSFSGDVGKDGGLKRESSVTLSSSFVFVVLLSIIAVDRGAMLSATLRATMFESECVLPDMMDK